MKEWTFTHCAELHNYDQVQTPVVEVNADFPPSSSSGCRHVSMVGLAKVR
jgi:hypothetical protein